MEELTYYNPTEIIFTDDSMERIGDIIKEKGYKRVCFIYGTSSLKKSGNYAKVINSLKKNDLVYIEKGGITANPDISFVRSFLEEVREFKPDIVLAIGGGSVLDTGKNLCAAYYYEGDSLDFNKKKAVPKKHLPLATVITIAAAGSEMSDSCVMSDYKTGFKSGFNSSTNRPTFSLEDPSLTLTVSLKQTSYGLVDILSHSFERYFSPSSLYEPCDYLALGVMKNIVDITPVLLKDPENYEARRSMMIASTLSHNGITSFGKKMRFICHGVEHQMSGLHPEVAHGLGLRFLLGEFLKVNEEELKDKIIRFGKEVFNLQNPSSKDVIKAFANYLDSFPLPHRMTEVGFSEEQEHNYISKLKI